MTVRVALTAIAIACSLLCLPALGAAQTGSAITGVVRTNILDLRLSKRLRLGKTSITANVDLSNALNANTPQYLNTQYGPQWLNVTNALSARVVRLGAQVGF